MSYIVILMSFQTIYSINYGYTAIQQSIKGFRIFLFWGGGGCIRFL
jgi:hypothetical protein